MADRSGGRQSIRERRRHDQKEAAKIDGAAVVRAGRRQENRCPGVDRDEHDEDEVGGRTGVKQPVVHERQDQNARILAADVSTRNATSVSRPRHERVSAPGSARPPARSSPVTN